MKRIHRCKLCAYNPCLFYDCIISCNSIQWPIHYWSKRFKTVCIQFISTRTVVLEHVFLNGQANKMASLRGGLDCSIMNCKIKTMEISYNVDFRIWQILSYIPGNTTVKDIKKEKMILFYVCHDKRATTNVVLFSCN